MILSPALPHGKTFFRLLALPAGSVLHVTRFLLACLLDGPCLSAAHAAEVEIDSGDGPLPLSGL